MKKTMAAATASPITLAPGPKGRSLPRRLGQSLEGFTHGRSRLLLKAHRRPSSKDHVAPVVGHQSLAPAPSAAHEVERQSTGGCRVCEDHSRGPVRSRARPSGRDGDGRVNADGWLVATVFELATRELLMGEEPVV
jgi:hypothetical protein